MNLRELRKEVSEKNYLSELDFEYIVDDIVELEEIDEDDYEEDDDIPEEDEREIENIEEIEEALRNAIHETDVIYYSNAMEFLSEEDVSLSECMEIAEGLGYSPGNLNSELLATLLKQERMSEELSEIF